MHKTKRRDFLKAGIGAAVAIASPWSLTTCRRSVQESSPETEAQVEFDSGNASSYLVIEIKYFR